MFEQAFVECQVRTRRPWTVAASFAGQVLFVAVMALLPLAQTGVITPARLAGILIAQPPGPPPPRAIETHPRTSLQRSRTQAPVVTTELRQPNRIPNQILIEDGDPQPALISDSAGPGLPGEIPAFDAAQFVMPAQVLRAPTPVSPATTARIRVGGSVQEGKILRQVAPVYPALARMAHVSGRVRLEAIIAKNGKIENLQVISGPPMLVHAALEAVRQWVYRPTLLNGDPVEVVTLIDVNFGLR
jgi:periplasmic protein TonB